MIFIPVAIIAPPIVRRILIFGRKYELNKIAKTIKVRYR